MNLKKIINDSKEKKILKLLSKDEIEKVIITIDEKLTYNKEQIKQSHKNKDEIEESTFALTILKFVLNEEIQPTKYSKFAKLNFEGWFSEDILELMRMLYILENNPKHKKKSILLANTLLACIKDGINYIGKETNNYPHNPINAMIWLDGASLQTRAAELASFFNRSNLDKEELDALLLKGQVTTSIMGHYPNLVGPAMIAVARKFEHLNNENKAAEFYTAVYEDFPQFLEEIEEAKKEYAQTKRKMKYSKEDVATISALIDACEGLKRLNKVIDEDLLKRAKEQLKKASNN